MSVYSAPQHAGTCRLFDWGRREEKLVHAQVGDRLAISSVGYQLEMVVLVPARDGGVGTS